MSEWIEVKRLPAETDLSEVIGFIRSRGLEVRVSEVSGFQVILVRNPDLVPVVSDLIERWQGGDLSLPEDETENRPPLFQAVPRLSPWQTPATLLLILLSILGTLLIETELGRQWIHWFTFQDFTRNGALAFEPVSEGIGKGEWWRLLTPAFIHFGLFHILFNSLWLWELGRRLELLLGWRQYLLLIIGWAIVANVTQYLWSGPGLFGGMSGVVYALIGYIWLHHRILPHPLMAVPPGLIGFMLVWFVLCLSGIVDMFMAGGIANGAHAGGLAIGILWGIVDGSRRAKRFKGR